MLGGMLLMDPVIEGAAEFRRLLEDRTSSEDAEYVEAGREEKGEPPDEEPRTPNSEVSLRGEEDWCRLRSESREVASGGTRRLLELLELAA